MLEILTSLGYSVRCAEDGFAALSQIRDSSPDILLSDLNMPGMSGFELLSVVRRRLPWIYVIATSGAFSGTEVPEGIAADAFYEKASSLSFLFKIVEHGARSRQTRVTRTRSQAAPHWIPPTRADNSSGTEVLLSCPECLRAFHQPPSDEDQTIHQTGCVYCDTPIQYAVVKAEKRVFAGSMR